MEAAEMPARAATYIGCVFASLYPNLGPNGLSVVLVRKNMIRPGNSVPLMCDYKVFMVRLAE